MLYILCCSFPTLSGFAMRSHMCSALSHVVLIFLFCCDVLSCFVVLFSISFHYFLFCLVLSRCVLFFLVLSRSFSCSSNYFSCCLMLFPALSMFVRSISCTPVTSYPFSLRPVFSPFVALCPAVFPSFFFVSFFSSSCPFLCCPVLSWCCSVISCSVSHVSFYLLYCCVALSRVVPFFLVSSRSFWFCSVLSRFVLIFLVMPHSF